MRYQEAIQKYLAARQASSREWRLSDTLVMCVELDASPADAFGTITMAEHSSQRRRGPRFVRITLFRLGVDSARGWDATEVDTQRGLSREEFMVLDAQRRVVEDWISGRLDLLPPSTSTVIADRLARRT